MNSGSPKVSVIIPAFNEEKGLATCVRRIREACDASTDIAGAYEIIVCDNNSTDTTAAVAEACGCKVVFEPINQISKARNRGASVATGEWLLFVDADSWPSPELIADMAPLLMSPEYIGCGSTIRVVDGPWWFKLYVGEQELEHANLQVVPRWLHFMSAECVYRDRRLSRGLLHLRGTGVCEAAEKTCVEKRATIHDPAQTPF